MARIRNRLIAFVLMAGVACMTGCADDGAGDDSGSESNLTVGGSASLAFEHTNIVSTYRSTGSAANQVTYEAETSVSDAHTVIKGTGILQSLSRDERTKNDDVPGKDVKGHSHLTISEIPGRPKMALLTVDQLAEIEQDGLVARLPFRYSAEADFANGSWADFLSGGAVELRVTDAGAKAYNAALRERFEASVNSLRDQVAATLTKDVDPSAKVTPIAVEEFKSLGRATISGTRTALTIENRAGATIRLRFGVSLDL